MKSLLTAICVTAVLLTLTGTSMAGNITPYTGGDYTSEYVNGSSLGNIIQNAGLRGPGGAIIDTTNDQLQYQYFTVTDGAANLQFEYIGSDASYQSYVGVFSASFSNPSAVSYNQVFTSNVDPVGSTFSVTIPDNHYFGFYINANGYNDSDGTFFSVNDWNSDDSSHTTTDHFLMFEGEDELIVAIEDLPRDYYDEYWNFKHGKYKTLGDKDYNDVVFTVKNVVPEPASLGLLGMGMVTLLGRRRRSRKA